MATGKNLIEIQIPSSSCYFVPFIGETPILEYKLVFGTVGPLSEEGIIIFGGEAEEFFNEFIGDEIADKTFIRKGETPPDSLTKPPFPVDFIPTAETISQYLYEQLFPAYLKTSGILVSVIVRAPRIDAVFTNESIRRLVLDDFH
ncbi:hypothetical protein LC087_17535 [Bacillus carboniphilus]|uniref:Uncharacterized protein n=1 Tax=Bacillus carboniphilus TaxID=86663 RepID=A0ABY9JSU7_9BACI|nr:hypothetical protein [Bacillus carboniphilus]WLR42475.1 hypothetical protein LC087_17535 [Bacillus carboniphilus]